MIGPEGQAPSWPELDAMDPDSLGGKLWAAAHETNEFGWTIERDHHYPQPGRTVSRLALDTTVHQISAWIEARIIERWERTKEPPTIIKISVTVDAQ